MPSALRRSHDAQRTSNFRIMLRPWDQCRAELYESSHITHFPAQIIRHHSTMLPKRVRNHPPRHLLTISSVILQSIATSKNLVAHTSTHIRIHTWDDYIVDGNVSTSTSGTAQERSFEHWWNLSDESTRVEMAAVLDIHPHSLYPSSNALRDDIVQSYNSVTRHEERDSWYNSQHYWLVSDGTSIRAFHTANSRQTAGSRESTASILSRKTPWQQILYDKYLILPEFDQTNWSDRGQHVEFGPEEGSTIDKLLTPNSVLGYSSTALVEKVQCKRIMLARKKIKCNWRLKREEALKEVAHLQYLSHAHVVRCVGTYVYGKELSILLYPATSYNLETFLDRCAELDAKFKLTITEGRLLHAIRRGVGESFGCLASAIDYIHSRFVKHMDIKPTNILIHDKYRFPRAPFQVHIAEFWGYKVI
ncbi:hypothetical protein CC86DRAFT_157225 [Ophiobolus disseminans]|uniref:Protein kinase domain-containing protein n=1 Tax=Ophiobolus disseminans TaxID=1469910 RepID=A0A6A6ZBP3_9PLEO|nr:hypothetical protein CC86DRAFT_157225 [Ophiobolus disseminans]